MWSHVQAADPADEDLFRRGLGADDEDVRSYAAVGLARIGAEGAVDALLTTIDDSPDLLHNDVTPSARELASLGDAVRDPLRRFHEAAEGVTKLRAQRALEMLESAADG